MIALVRERLAHAASVCVLTGSGISSESGLPTFRGAGGLWRTHRVEQLASPRGFADDPELVWAWYNERRIAHLEAEPNAGHVALAALERRVADFTLVTQNVDSLHLRAGSQNVLELHGDLRAARCDRCGARRPLEVPLAPDQIGHVCGGRFRPNIVWFGESLPRRVWDAAVSAAARADVVLVIGTSGIVQPAALLATQVPRPDAFVVEVNTEPSAISERADALLLGPAAQLVPKIIETGLGPVVSCRAR